MESQADRQSALALVRAYHARTMHHFQRYARGPLGLDWESQPDPFRRYAGAELLKLEHVPLEQGPLYREVFGGAHVPPAALERASLSRLFEDSLALSAWKQYGSSTWALRVNPSSGNLHPTEAHILAPPVPGLCRDSILAHYAPREHALEVRARIPLELREGEFVVALSSIHWREAWKYGERSYRYCQHDAGHAIAALAIAAGGLGWRASLLDDLGRDDLLRLLRLADPRAAEPEEPDIALLVETRPRGGVARSALAVPAAFDALVPAGLPNALSSEHVEWELVDLVAHAARKPRTEHVYAAEEPLAEPAPDARLLASDLPLRPILRQRRSAVDFDGETGMAREDFFRILRSTMRFPARVLPWRPRVALLLFVHRVRDLEPGLYLLARDPAALERLRAACTRPFSWAKPADTPADLPLFELARGDWRAHAAALSCNQEIASDGAFSLGMLAEFDAPLEQFGPWFYPRLFWECGAIGQVLYLEAEAIGLRGTGIGCFFDEPVHQVAGLETSAWRSLYHFTVGGPVEDTRLQSWPPYPARDG
jgi:nitroreductase